VHGEYKWHAALARAEARGKKGDLAGKAADCALVLSEQKAQGAIAADLPYEPDALACLGDVELAGHRTTSAIAYFEQSVALEKRFDRSRLPLARFGLARALRVARRDPDRARALAENARGALAQLPSREEKVTSIDQWLKAAF
jgi:uncharacterized protein with PIN domain